MYLLYASKEVLNLRINFVIVIDDLRSLILSQGDNELYAFYTGK